ncbi:hypothetical protein AMAG_11184 [Allomyces macrogynus ATCC 38327]|uniref:Uncharacterized protein n=1 Tax=Allomyces macrogynus (strain ATCC 38327) TaxID=578462 RepID=A0A0L0SWG5_ALLM3|nr:hypothetical protein AMAG_11184 [Allomyces macrogynus ATCC 38327]|eukprot:KNE66684.1 hypothetical protein AMAG_11184 [Allomyces macrogynus ATCC 38327]
MGHHFPHRTTSTQVPGVDVLTPTDPAEQQHLHIVSLVSDTDDAQVIVTDMDARSPRGGWYTLKTNTKNPWPARAAWLLMLRHDAKGRCVALPVPVASEVTLLVLCNNGVVCKCPINASVFGTTDNRSVR